MPEIVHSQKEFRDFIDRLTNEVSKVRQARLNEYRAAGVEPPSRVTFEEIDLQRFRDDLLSVQKTLQWRGHNQSLGTVYLDKARLLAFAGVCQFVKDRYNGAFWENYKSEIGWGPDNTVYNTIWARAFKLEGAELIESASRREFVDSFINETGIPPHLQDDLLEFFGLFWTYFREERTDADDIVRLITDVVDDDIDLSRIPERDSSVLNRVCNDVSDLASSFARRVAKLLTIASYIETADEIIPDGRDENLDRIEVGTGINPRSVFRNEARLEKFWSIILERVTPGSLVSIILARFRNSVVEKPDGSQVQGADFRCDMYGGYSVGGTRFVCVPDISLSLEFLEMLDEGRPVEISSGMVMRSADRIRLIREGENGQESRRSSMLPLYVEEREMGFISFLAHEEGTTSVKIRGVNGEDRGRVRTLARRYFNPRLRVRWNWRRQKYALYARLGSVSLVFRAQPSSTCLLFANSRTKPLAELKLNESGEGRAKIQDLIFASPEPGEVEFRTVVDGGETRLLDSLMLERVMLFARSGGGQIPQGSESRTGKIPTSGFVLLISSEVNATDLVLENLVAESDGTSYGEYKLLPLRWEATTRPCSIEVRHSDERFIWEFDTCLEFEIELRRCGWTKPEGFRFPHFAATNPEDFELRILPPPSDKEARSIRLEATGSDGEIVSLPLVECGLESYSEEEAGIGGDNLRRLLEPILDQCDQPTRISVNLASEAGRSNVRDFVFLPVFSVRYEGFHTGTQPSVEITVDRGGKSYKGKLNGDGQKSELNEPSIYVENEGESIGVEKEIFSGVVVIPEFNLHFDVELGIFPAGCYLWSEDDCSYSELEDIEFTDLPNWELLTIDPVPGGSLEVEAPIQLETRKGDSGCCRRHSILEGQEICSRTVEAGIKIADASFGFFINNGPRVEEISFRPHTRGRALIGRHLISGGTDYSIFYRVHDERRNEILRTKPYSCDPHIAVAREVVIPLPESYQTEPEGSVVIEGFLRKPYGVEAIAGARFRVSTEDRLIEDDLAHVRKCIEECRVNESEAVLDSLLQAIDGSALADDDWQDLRFEVAMLRLRVRSKNLTGRCQMILRKGFKINV